MQKAKPKDRSEQEVAGYRDVLADIHTNYNRIQLSSHLIKNWHQTLYRYTEETGEGRGKKRTTQSLRWVQTGGSWFDFKRSRLWPPRNSWNA